MAYTKILDLILNLSLPFDSCFTKGAKSSSDGCDRIGRSIREIIYDL